MSNLQAALRIAATQSDAPSDVVQVVNKHILRTTTAEKFATFFYSILDTETGRLEYTNAGHNYPILVRNSGDHELLRDGGVIVGMMEGAAYASRSIVLKPGDLLVLYTDGITEAMDSQGDIFGEPRLIDIVNQVPQLQAQGVLDYILEAVIEFTHGHLQADDLTLVVIKATG